MKVCSLLWRNTLGIGSFVKFDPLSMAFGQSLENSACLLVFLGLALDSFRVMTDDGRYYYYSIWPFSTYFPVSLLPGNLARK